MCDIPKIASKTIQRLKNKFPIGTSSKQLFFRSHYIF